MTDREKLVEMINHVSEMHIENLMQPGGAETLADHLLSHGVTVKEPQKPLQMDELKEHEDQFIWLEMKDRSNWRAFEPAKIDCVKRKITYFDCIGSDEEFYYENVFYNVEWRCWAEKPTEAERKAAEWE